MTDVNTPEPVASEEEQDVREDDVVVDDELLVEDVSIDGMCGVY
jgi:mycofactocin precursor